MEAIYQEYLGYLEELSALLEQMTETVERKADAARDSDLVQMDECMKKEQVYSMTLRSMDQKRDKMLAEMGLVGVPLRELASRAPESMYREVKAASEKLRRRYEMFQAASQVARDTLECNLRAIENLQRAQNAPPEEDRPHQADFRV